MIIQQMSIGMVTGMHMQFARQAGIVPTTQKPQTAPIRTSSTVQVMQTPDAQSAPPAMPTGMSQTNISTGKIYPQGERTQHTTPDRRPAIAATSAKGRISMAHTKPMQATPHIALNRS